MRNGPDPMTLMMLISLNRKIDRLLAGQRREDYRTMEMQDALDLISGKVDTLSTDDAAAFAALNAKIAAGQTLTPEEETQVSELAAKLNALDAADQAVLNPSGTVGTPGALDGSPAEDGGDSGIPAV